MDISGLTMTQGYSTSAAGGAIAATGGSTTITDSAITDSAAAGSRNGGGIDAGAPIKLIRTEVSGNTAHLGAGINAHYGGYGGVSISQSKISGNRATSGGGGIADTHYITLDDTKVTGNHATNGAGGGISRTARP